MSNSRTLAMGNGISPVGMPDTIPGALRGPLNAATSSRKRGIVEMHGQENFSLDTSGRGGQLRERRCRRSCIQGL